MSVHTCLYSSGEDDHRKQASVHDICAPRLSCVFSIAITTVALSRRTRYTPSTLLDLHTVCPGSSYTPYLRCPFSVAPIGPPHFPGAVGNTVPSALALHAKRKWNHSRKRDVGRRRRRPTAQACTCILVTCNWPPVRDQCLRQFLATRQLGGCVYSAGRGASGKPNCRRVGPMRSRGAKQHRRLRERCPVYACMQELIA